MPLQLTCSRGHSWEVPDESFDPSADTAPCPVCSDPVALTPPEGTQRFARPLSGDRPSAVPVEPPGYSLPLPPRQSTPSRSTTPEAVPPAEPANGPVPGYEVLGELGRGGMGVVYKARQVKANRVVALKMILAGAHAGAGERARFTAEAEAVARLQHPNIVQVFDVGESDGLPYFSLEFCPGGSLEKHLAGGPLPPARAASLAEALAAAMAQAHRAGIVHRDLKPANVLLGADGTPKVTDFGIARRLDADGGQTGTGALIGTPSYMAPEQAEGRGKEAGPAADVYALGAVLYETLTGRPPFRGASALETLRQVRGQEPVPVRRLQPGVPRDLETVCLKCLEKDPARRYASAEALADDLRRFREGRPIVARPVGPMARAAKWARREPRVAAAVAAAAVAVTAGVVGVLLALDRALDEMYKARIAEGKETEAARVARQREAEANDSAFDAQMAAAYAQVQEHEAKVRRDEAVAEKRAALANLAYAQLTLAQNARKDGDLGEARAWLAAVPPGHRGFEWRLLDRAYDGGLVSVPVPGGDVTDVACLPDGRIVSRTAPDMTLCFWGPGAADLRGTATGRASTGRPCPLAVSPDGRRAVTAADGDVMQLWDTAGARLLREFGPATPPQGWLHASCLAFSPDGRGVARGGGGPSCPNVAEVWDTETGGLRLALPSPWGRNGVVHALAFSPDGTLLATLGVQRQGDKSEVRLDLWDTRDGRLRSALPSPGRIPGPVAFSPDGSVLAIASPAPGPQAEGRAVALIDTRSGAVRKELTGEPVAPFAFSPDGAHLAGVGANGVQVWDAHTGERLALLATAAGARSLCFTPDGRHLVTGGRGAVRFWDWRGEPAPLTLPGEGWSARALAYSPDGTLFATGGSGGVVRLRDARDGSVLRELRPAPALKAAGARPTPPPPVRSLAFSPDGNRLAGGFGPEGWKTPGEVTVWEVPGGTPLARFPASQPDGLAFSPGGDRLAVGGPEYCVIHDLKGGPPVSARVLEGLGLRTRPEGVQALAFSPDGDLLAAAQTSGRVALYAAGTGARLSEIPAHQASANAVAFSPDGRRILSAGGNRIAPGEVRLWDAGTGRLLLDLKGPTGAVYAACFSRDGGRIAATGADRTVRVWEAAEGRPLLTLPRSPREIGGPRSQSSWSPYQAVGRAVAFSPDGMRLAVGGDGGVTALQLWDARPTATRLVLAGHLHDTSAAAFTPGGAWLVTAGRTISKRWSVRVWDPVSGRLLHDWPFANAVRRFVVSADGSRLAAADSTGLGRVFDLRTGKTLLEWQGNPDLPGPAALAMALTADGSLFALDRREALEVWDLASGKEVGHFPEAMFGLEAGFPAGGGRASLRTADGWLTWDLKTGRRAPAAPAAPPVELHSWTPTLRTDIAGGVVRLVDLTGPDEGERLWRAATVAPDPMWHALVGSRRERVGDRFGAAFHLERLLRLQPERRTELLGRLARVLADDPLRLARAAVHTPGAVDAGPTRPAVVFLAMQRNASALRTLGGLFLRGGKPAEALAPLRSALALRDPDRPPVEELMLAWAFAGQGQAAEVREWLGRADAWADRYRRPVSVASAIARAPGGPVCAVTEFFKPQPDPRYDPADWETWHELDVFRREAEAKLVAQPRER